MLPVELPVVTLSSDAGCRYDLLALPLAHLIEDALVGYRTYELLQIVRPAHIFPYLRVLPTVVPEALESQYRKMKADIDPAEKLANALRKDLGQGGLPDGLLNSEWTMREANRWLKASDGLGEDSFAETPAMFSEWVLKQPSARDLVLAALGSAKRAHEAVKASNDELVRYELNCLSRAEHCLDFEERLTVETRLDYVPLGRRRVAPEIWSALGELLGNDDINSVSYFGPASFEILRLLGTGQIRRAKSRNLSPTRALPVYVFVSEDHSTHRDLRIASQWQENLSWMAEGLFASDLLVVDRDDRLEERPPRKLPAPKAVFLLGRYRECFEGFDWKTYDTFSVGVRLDGGMRR